MEVNNVSQAGNPTSGGKYPQQPLNRKLRGHQTPSTVRRKAHWKKNFLGYCKGQGMHLESSECYKHREVIIQGSSYNNLIWLYTQKLYEEFWYYVFPKRRTVNPIYLNHCQINPRFVYSVLLNHRCVSPLTTDCDAFLYGTHRFVLYRHFPILCDGPWLIGSVSGAFFGSPPANILAFIRLRNQSPIQCCNQYNTTKIQQRLGLKHVPPLVGEVKLRML
jgi:hypothetical protein